ncbi:hypothetical protein ANN_15985 [Periplaneta americana]|uniref:DDE-1 domain-containing protein n=1 Tax=Periplaneta americana TaxID=6978 RepID=A0ABQ8SHQ3_PERAM|nr:hypothetical protein ANN_15985 [Periplaneta americana]
MKPSKIVAETGKKIIYSKTFAESGVTQTVLGCCSASGTAIPPMIIFKGVRLLNGLDKDTPTGSLVRVSKNGWISSELFLEWMNHFVRNISPARPVFLLLDSHASHVGIGVIDFARENDIHFMTFPSHCSHSLQPLDLSVYKSFKNVWANELDRYKHNNPVGVPTRFDFGKLFSVPYAIAFSTEKIRNGLREAGIYPMNRNAVQPEAIASSRLTAGDGDFSQTRTGTLPSDSANGIIWNILCLPKCTDGNAGERRRNVDPKARVLTPLPEKRLRGRPKKTEAGNAAPSTEPSSSSSEENETACKVCHGTYSRDVAARNGAQWIQSIFCTRSYHELCANADNSPQFTCFECYKSVEFSND